MRYHFTLVKWLSSKCLQTVNTGESVTSNSPALSVGIYIATATMDTKGESWVRDKLGG